jgi:7-cyano-7-deazaguanine synthase in queuosine biosynthesis
MATIAQVTAIIADQCSASQVAEGVAYAEEIGYADAEEFFSLAMAAILYSASDLASGIRYPVERGSLDSYLAEA